MHVFTYGTLLFPEVWQAVVGREFATISGTATGFAIYGVRNAEYPGIIAASDNDKVHGIVYLDVDDESLQRLDEFEDPIYERQLLRIACEDGQCREAAAYVVPMRNKTMLTDERWRSDEFVASGHLERFLGGFGGRT